MENNKEEEAKGRPYGISGRDLINIIEAKRKGKEELLKVMREIWGRSEVIQGSEKVNARNSTNS